MTKQEKTERELFLSLKEMVFAASNSHYATGCTSGWGRCQCPLAEQMRASEALLFKINRRYRRSAKEKVAA